MDRKRQRMNKELFWASERGDNEKILKLLDKGADIDYVYGVTVLGVAAERGHTNTVQLLIGRHADVNKADWDERTPLHWSCSNGYIECAQVLLDEGADITAIDDWGRDAVLCACQSGNVQLMELLLQHHGSLTTIDEDGDGAMYTACYYGRFDMINYLKVKKGLSLDSPLNKKGQSPKMILQEKLGNNEEINKRRRQCLDQLPLLDTPSPKEATAPVKAKPQGILPQPNHDKTDEEIARLRNQVKELSKTVDDVQQEKKQLMVQQARTNEQLQQLMQDNQRDKQQLQNVIQDNQKLRQDNQQLILDNQQLQEQVSVLQVALNKRKHDDSDMSWKVSHKEVKMTQQELGRGGWGVIWIGMFREQKVAVKQMHEAITCRVNLDLLHREINTMAQLRHPNLLQFIGAVFDHPSGNPMIITEIMDTSLRKAYEDKSLTPSRDCLPVCVGIMRDVAVGLNYLHCLHDPIIHRDVSSANVLLESKGNRKWKTKISDFGSANKAKQAMTRAAGAAVYSAPESLQSVSITGSRPRSLSTKMDVFSYGVLLCEVLNCEFPDVDLFPRMLQQIKRRSASLHELICVCVKEHSSERPSMKQVIETIDSMNRI